MITGISGFGIFCPKMAVSWRISVFQKMPCWNPYFYSVFWVRAFLAKLSKKGNFGHPPKKRKFWLITEKLFFWYFCVFPLFFFYLSLFSFSCFFLVVCFFSVCFVFFSFLSLLLIEKPVFPPGKGHFCLFLSVSLCFSLAFFGLPLFQFLFLCLSLVLFFLSSFLSFFFAFFWFLVFVSVLVFLSSLLLFHERNNIKIFNCNLFFHQYPFFFWFPVLLFLSNPFFLIFAFSWF